MNDKQKYLKEYYQKNKEKYKQYASKNKNKVVYCDCCNKNVKYMSMSSHRKSKHHIDNMNNINVNEKLLEKKIISCLRKLIDF